MPRLLAIMGSGETSPTMVKTHRQLLDRLGPPPVPAVVLDTPFGFQENADELTARAVEYFRTSVGAELGVASFRSAEGDGARGGDALAYESMLNQLRAARYVFAGPGSPSYALRQWSESVVPKVLREKLQAGGPGGCVTFASAAALTVGVATVPVYEIYKVGEPPHWLEGLDLLAEAGLRTAVIPHYDNAEGGTHDTRYCYLGERRLQTMERLLPDDVVVLGVDEHTGVVFDLDMGTASVIGRGGVTVRQRGAVRVVPADTTVAIDSLRSVDAASRGGAALSSAPAASALPGGSEAPTPLLEMVRQSEAAFADAVGLGDADESVRVVLGLEEELERWSQETFGTDEMEQARAALRGLIVRLGEAARSGLRDPAEVVGPFVDALLAQRARARDAERFAEADAIRDRLVSLGVEVQDDRQGSKWRLLS